MRVRPLVVFILIASWMVGWLSVRMWVGDSVTVWRISSLLGAWAPLAAAVIFLYIRAVGGREDSVLAAWLVRAIGMHCVLVWLLGFNDWLRGPPGQPPAWNTDTGMPLVLLLFAPVFAVSVLAASWVRRLSARLDPPPVAALRALPIAAGVAPYRGTAMRAHATHRQPPSLVPYAVGALACAVAYGSPVTVPWVLGGSLVALALVTLPGRRALGPGITSLVTVTGLLLARDPHVGFKSATTLGVLWPWLSLLVVSVYLCLVEGLLRVRVSPGTQARA